MEKKLEIQRVSSAAGSMARWGVERRILQGGDRMNKIVVARPVDGVTLNSALEFLLDDNGEVMVFDSEEQARKFLTDAGVEPEELRHMKFMENK